MGKILAFEKTDYNLNYSVWIDKLGDNAIELVKVIVEICDASQVEVMKLIGGTDEGSLGGLVCSVASFEEASEIKAKLESAGAVISVKHRRFDVVLEKIGESKDDVVNTLVEVLDIDDEEARDIVSSAEDSLFGETIKTAKNMAAAERLKRNVEESGATVSVEEKTIELDEDGNPVDDEWTDEDIEEAVMENLTEAEQEELDAVKPIYCKLNGKLFGPFTNNQFTNMVRFGIVNEEDAMRKSIEEMEELGVCAFVAETADYVEPNVPDMSDFELEE